MRKYITKKYIAIAALICIMLVSGCTEENGGGLIIESTPTPTPEPTPEPVRVLVVTDCGESETEGFFEAIEEAANGTGWVMEYKANGMAESFSGYSGIIALRTKEATSIAALAQSGVALTVIDISGASVPPVGIACASYDYESDYDVLFETALNYPPHDTPVRFLAILNSEGSALDGLYQQGINEGKVFNRASMYLSGESSVKEFMDKYLNKFIVGMIDGIIVEDFETAKEVIAILNEKGRDDAEVFTLIPGNVEQGRSILQRYVFPVALGTNINAEAAKQVENLQAMLNGGVGESYTFKASAIEFGAE